MAAKEEPQVSTDTTDKFAPGLFGRMHVEESIRRCVNPFGSGMGRVVLGYGPTEMYFLDFHPEEKELTAAGSKCYRIYVETDHVLNYQIPAELLLTEVSSDRDFVEKLGGEIIAAGVMGNVGLHVCSDGVFVVYDETLIPLDVFSRRLGHSDGRPNIFIGTAVENNVARRSIGLKVLLAMELVRYGVSSPIAMGEGERNFPDKRRFFFQFDISDFIISKKEGVFSSTAPFRVYLDVHPDEADQLNCLGDGFVTDAAFLRDGGQIYLPKDIGVRLHVCHCGVKVYYDESEDPFRVFSVRIGDSKPRKNRHGGKLEAIGLD